MSFFVDANIIVYSASDSAYRRNCDTVLEAVARGAADGRLSPAVLEEVWYLELSGKAGNLQGLTKRAYAIFTPLLAVTDEAFRVALGVQAPGLGPNDRLHVGTCLSHGIDTIVSADGGFDVVPDLRRVDPLDTEAVAQLLKPP